MNTVRAEGENKLFLLLIKPGPPASLWLALYALIVW